ncbi:MAG TPA: hypothetical protein VIQ98_04335 [Gemmatimonadales bacterium]
MIVKVARVALGLQLLGSTLSAQAPGTASCRPTLAPRGGGPQVSDTLFDPPIARPAFAAGSGPTVLLDEGHFNFHTVEGRYAPFVRLLRRDGLVVRALREPLASGSLAAARILVIANAISERMSQGPWALPNAPAFSGAEIAVLERWVSQGGSLLLIADHMPFPGAVEALAAAFGIQVTDGFATDSSCAIDEMVFRRSDGSLADHPITNGRHRRERVDSVRSFTGQAFRLSRPGQPLLTLGAGAVVLLPSTAWRFSDSTPRIPAEGMLQGAVLSHGRGRVAMFGEAAMFSAQVSGPSRRPMGMNAPHAGENPRFLLNLMHWLAERRPQATSNQ